MASTPDLCIGGTDDSLHVGGEVVNELRVPQYLPVVHRAQTNGPVLYHAFTGCVALGPSQYEAVRLGGQHSRVLVLP